MERKRTQLVVLITVGGGLALIRVLGGRRFARRAAHRVTRMARYETGRLEGLRYRLAGRHPDPAASDAMLADRVRSQLGPLERRLDIPHVHVMARDHDVTLHGDVVSADQVEVLLEGVRSIAGVQSVDSHLHVGLLPSDTRPSTGTTVVGESRALHCLLAAAHGGGAAPGTDRAAVRGVLSAFAGLLPAGERRHVLAHLPADVRALVESHKREWSHARPRRMADFATVALPMLPVEERQCIVESVLGAVRDLIPEECTDVAAVLPEELREVWKTAIPL